MLVRISFDFQVVIAKSPNIKPSPNFPAIHYLSTSQTNLIRCQSSPFLGSSLPLPWSEGWRNTLTGHRVSYSGAYVEYAGKPCGKLLHFRLNFGRGSVRTQYDMNVYGASASVQQSPRFGSQSAARSREIANLSERRTSPWPSCWRITPFLWRSTVLTLAVLTSSALPRCRCTHSLFYTIVV